MELEKKSKQIISFNIDSDAIIKLKQIVCKNRLSEQVNQLILDFIDFNIDKLDEPEEIRIRKKRLGELNRRKSILEHQRIDVDTNLPLVDIDIKFIVSEIERLKKLER